MKKRTMDTDTDLRSKEWTERDGLGTEIAFRRAGFTTTGEILGLRIYDMLNIRGIDCGRADEMMEALYRFFNENDDPAGLFRMEYDKDGKRCPDIQEWFKEHPDPSAVRVRDIILAEGLDIDSMFYIYSSIVSRFWRSKEYTRSYRYRNYQELLRQAEKEEEK